MTSLTATEPEPVLSVSGLVVRYGGVLAVDEVTLSVAAGSLCGLIGPNGAGKTSFLDAVSGFAPVARGTMELGGQLCEGLAPHRLAQLGLTRTFQSLELFDDLTVAENMLVAADRPHWWSVLRDVFGPSRSDEATDAALDEAMMLCAIASLAQAYPAQVSKGERHRVALARAVVARPKLLLLDEPAAGLDPSETDQLADILRDLAGRGTGVVVVDHDMGLVLGSCDHVFVLDQGRLIASGSPDDIRSDRAVVAAYLGGIEQ